MLSLNVREQSKPSAGAAVCGAGSAAYWQSITTGWTVRHLGTMRLLALLCIGTALFLLSGSPGRAGPMLSPQETLAAYLDAMRTAKWESAYTYLSAQNRAVKSVEEYILESASSDSFVTALSAPVFSYTVLDTQTDFDTATVTVVIETLDFLALLDELPDLGEDNPRQWLADRLASGDVPTRLSTQEYTLLRESAGWKVFLDWEAQKAREEQRAARAHRKAYLQLAALFAGAAACGLLVGCFLRLLGRFLGYPRWLLAVVVLCTLRPWLDHHMGILRAVRDHLKLTTADSEGLLFELTFVGPALVLLAVILVVAAPRRLRLGAAAVPASAFLTTWHVTFALAYRVVPDDVRLLDNKMNVWLAIWCFGATILLTVYCFPALVLLQQRVGRFFGRLNTS